MRDCVSCVHYDARPGVKRFCLACPRMPAPTEDCDAWIAAVPEALGMRVLPKPTDSKGASDDQLHQGA